MNAPTTLSFSSDAADQKLKIGKIIKGAVKVVKKVAPIAQVIFPGSAVIGKVAGVANLL
jgi:hypothetical protein